MPVCVVVVVDCVHICVGGVVVGGVMLRVPVMVIPVRPLVVLLWVGVEVVAVGMGVVYGIAPRAEVVPFGGLWSVGEVVWVIGGVVVAMLWWVCGLVLVRVVSVSSVLASGIVSTGLSGGVAVVCVGTVVSVSVSVVLSFSVFTFTFTVFASA